MSEITIGSKVTFGSGDQRYDPVGEVVGIWEEPSGLTCDGMWPTHDNTCLVSDLRLCMEPQSVTAVTAGEN